MKLIEKLIEEIELRKNGKYGSLENLSDVELYALAYQFKVKFVGKKNN